MKVSMITVVIDTNVLIDAPRDAHGYAHLVVAEAIAGRVRAIASVQIEREYRALLPKTLSKTARQELEAFFNTVERIVVSADATVRTEDSEDQKFLDCAQAQHADFIITNDHHLLEVKRAGGAKIATPKEFIALLRTARDREGKGEWRSWVKQILGG